LVFSNCCFVEIQRVPPQQVMAYLDVECVFYIREMETQQKREVQNTATDVPTAQEAKEEEELRTHKERTRKNNKYSMDETRHPILFITRLISFVTSLLKVKRNNEKDTNITKSTILRREDSFNEKIAMLFSKDNLQFYLHLENQLSPNTRKKQDLSPMTQFYGHDVDEQGKKKLNNAGASNKSSDESDSDVNTTAKPTNRLKALEQGFFSIFHRSSSKESRKSDVSETSKQQQSLTPSSTHEPVPINGGQFHHDVSTSPFQTVKSSSLSSLRHQINDTDVLSDDGWMTPPTDVPWANKLSLSPSSDVETTLQKEENIAVETTVTLDDGDKLVDKTLENSPQQSGNKDIKKTTTSHQAQQNSQLITTFITHPPIQLNRQTKVPLIAVELLNKETKRNSVDEICDPIPIPTRNVSIPSKEREDLQQEQSFQSQTVVLSQKLVAHSTEVVDQRAFSPFEAIEFGFNRDGKSPGKKSPIIGLSDGWTSQSSSPFENISVKEDDGGRSSSDSPFENILFD